jgi:hypothetical protein
MKSNACVCVCVALFLKQQNEYTQVHRLLVKIINKDKAGRLFKNEIEKNE